MKGISTGLVIVMATALATAIGFAVISSSNPVISSSEDRLSIFSDEVNDSTEEAQCVNECGVDHPQRGSEFYQCKEANC